MDLNTWIYKKTVPAALNTSSLKKVRFQNFRQNLLLNKIEKSVKFPFSWFMSWLIISMFCLKRYNKSRKSIFPQITLFHIIWWAFFKKYLSLGTLIRSHSSRHYLLKVSNRNTRAKCEICSKLTIKTPECRLGWIFLFLWGNISY